MVRDLLGNLTSRGRLLVGAGCAVLIVTWIFGERDLLRVGALALCLPLIAAAAVLRTRFRLTCARGLAPARIAMGAESRAVIRLGNSSRFPTGTLLVEDRVPALLGTPERLVTERLAPGERREVATVLSGSARGRYDIGPVSITLRDPFGLCEVRRSFTATDSLIVVPRICPLPGTGIVGLSSGRGDSEARSIAHTGDDDVIPRTYRIGDELRRVHWRATARSGELMVRREEQPWRTTATVLLDRRSSSHTGTFPDTSLELAVSMAASAAVHLSRQGLRVRVLDTAGITLAQADADGEAEATLLDALALVEPSPAGSLVDSPPLRRDIHDGTLVAVVARLDLRDARVLAELRGSGGTAAALIIDARAWSSEVPADNASATSTALTEHGWRAALLTPDRSTADEDVHWATICARAAEAWRSLAAAPAGAIR